MDNTERKRTAASQRAVNPPPSGTVGSIPTRSTERIVETWEGLSPTRGVVRVNILVSDPTPIYDGTEWAEGPAGLLVQQPRRVGWMGGGAGYDGSCEDGKAFEVKTIGLGSVDRAREFALAQAHACRDVPEWHCMSKVVGGVEVEAPDDDPTWSAPIVPANEHHFPMRTYAGDRAPRLARTT